MGTRGATTEVERPESLRTAAEPTVPGRCPGGCRWIGGSPATEPAAVRTGCGAIGCPLAFRSPAAAEALADRLSWPFVFGT